MALNVDNIETGLSNFAFDLYQKCADESYDKNIVLSPYSVAIALALLSQIAQKNTLAQILRGLQLTTDKSSLANDFSQQYNSIAERVGESTLSIVNRLYVKNGFQINKTFQDVAVDKFRSDVESIDFSNRANAAAEINSFVANKTNNKIQNLIEPNSLAADTIMMIVNVIYFKGLWEIEFPVHRTAPGDFFIDKINKVQIDFMTEDERFRYAELNDISSKAVELKYKHSKISFVVVLPDENAELSRVETSIKNTGIGVVINRLRDEYVEVTLPKFKFQYQIELNDILKKMGMTDMFRDNADFSGLSESNQSFKVSTIIHKAFIEIDETGTEAAAATGIQVVPLSLDIWQQKKKIFKADRPFLFYIVDREKHTVLFNGRYIH